MLGKVCVLKSVFFFRYYETSLLRIILSISLRFTSILKTVILPIAYFFTFFLIYLSSFFIIDLFFLYLRNKRNGGNSYLNTDLIFFVEIRFLGFNWHCLPKVFFFFLEKISYFEGKLYGLVSTCYMT